MTVHVLTWDWRGQPNIDELDRMVYDLSATGLPVRITNVENTGCDQLAIVIADRELTQKEAEEALSAYWQEER